jgi:intracellular septation protein
MNQLLEFSPLIAFVAVFEFWGIYWATAALMLACVLQLFVHRVRSGKFKPIHAITVAVLLPLGGATLLLHDHRFIQWKPTVLLGIGAAAFLGSMLIGKQPLARRMLEAAFPEPIEMSARAWLLINALWVGWLGLLAAANIYVARNFTESTWVHFKVYGITLLLFVFMLPQILWLSGKTTTHGDPLPSSRARRLRERLEGRFTPSLLTIDDESHLHAGHAGAAGGQSHFRIRIVAEAFRGISPVARHRLVYAAVDDLLKTDIHALAIEASAPAG